MLPHGWLFLAPVEGCNGGTLQGKHLGKIWIFFGRGDPDIGGGALLSALYIYIYI